MKAFIVAGLILSAGVCQARPMVCTQTEDSKKTSDVFQGQLTFVVGPQASSITVTVTEGQSTDVYVAKRDDHDSLASMNEDSSYNLDEEYDRKVEARFVSPKWQLAGSDADSIVFVEKTLLAGRSGKLSLSGGQANDGDNGTPWLWFRAYEFNCK